MKKEVKLKLRTERYELTSASAVLATPEPERIELFTEAMLQTVADRVEISYTESELSGLGKSKTKLIFRKSEPDSLTMMRTGEVSVTMMFSPGLKHSCRYLTPVMPFEMIILTRSLSNRLLSDGVLELDYDATVVGASHSRTRLRLELCEK